MSFWKTFGKWAIPAGAIAATVLTGGAASPLIGMALGAGSGLASSKLSGQSWKKSLINAGIGGALGGIGGGALKGMGGTGTVMTQAAKYAPSAVGAAKGLTAGIRADPQAGGAAATPTLSGMQAGQGFLNPMGLTAQRRTDMAGMGTRNYG